MSLAIQRRLQVSDDLAGKRLDQVAAELIQDFSRARLQAWIKTGELRVNGQVQKAKTRLLGGEWLELNAQLEDQVDDQPEAIGLDIHYEDEHLLVLNKAAGLVVHPGAGNPAGTLLNALLNHQPTLNKLPRAGIVHRLDKDTSGLMVVAKTQLAYHSLVDQLQDRSMGREYEALVQGVMTGGGRVDKPIGRHPHHRTKMAVREAPQAKPAVTHYRVIERLRAHTHVRLQLETGRTHQIRVHMAYLHYPLVGDTVYAGRTRLVAGLEPALQAALQAFPRQALHAKQLRLYHPETSEAMQWEIDLAEDIQGLLQLLRQDTKPD